MTYGLTLVGMIALSTPSSVALTQTATSCNADVAVTMAVQPDIPRVLPATKVTVEASVAVGPDGAVKAVQIVKSSGDKEVDSEVVDAATKSKYKPKMVDCQPVDGMYLLRVDFGP